MAVTTSATLGNGSSTSRLRRCPERTQSAEPDRAGTRRGADR
jgi:hypothetical protein